MFFFNPPKILDQVMVVIGKAIDAGIYLITILSLVAVISFFVIILPLA